jgi:hypothetical protein
MPSTVNQFDMPNLPKISALDFFNLLVVTCQMHAHPKASSLQLVANWHGLPPDS